MSNNIFIKATNYTPETILDEGKKQFSVSGVCIDSDMEFFRQALENLDKVLDSVNKDELFTIIIKISTFEDRTIKGLFYPLFSIYEKYRNQPLSKKLIIKWFYDSNDPGLSMKEAGEEYADLFEINFEFTPY